jgi:hypothetical protein
MKKVSKHVMTNQKQRFDPEWLRLLYLAKQLGMSKEEVRHFFRDLPEVAHTKSL